MRYCSVPKLRVLSYTSQVRAHGAARRDKHCDAGSKAIFNRDPSSCEPRWMVDEPMNRWFSGSLRLLEAVLTNHPARADS